MIKKYRASSKAAGLLGLIIADLAVREVPILHGSQLGGWPWPLVPLNITLHQLDNHSFHFAFWGQAGPAGTETSHYSYHRFWFLFFNLKQAKEQKGKGKILLILFSPVLLWARNQFLWRRSSGFQTLSPFPQSTGSIAHALTSHGVVANSQFHYFGYGYLCFCFASSFSPFCSLLPHSSRGQIHIEIWIFFFFF